MSSTMQLKAKTYGGTMNLIIAAEIVDGKVIPSQGVVSIIKLTRGIDDVAEIYQTRLFLKDRNNGDSITYHIDGKDYTFNWEQGMELWSIADQLWWEYAKLAYPEVAEAIED